MKKILCTALLVFSVSAQAEDRWFLAEETETEKLYVDTESVTFGSVWLKTIFKQEVLEGVGALVMNLKFDCSNRTGGAATILAYDKKGNYLPSRSDKNIDVLNDPITPESHAEQAFLVACAD